jgi:hypothetical protein
VRADDAGVPIVHSVQRSLVNTPACERNRYRQTARPSGTGGKHPGQTAFE